MPKGSLVITVRTAESAFPVAEARVILTDAAGTVLGEARVTGENGGVSEEFYLEAPDPALSLYPGQALPYAVYDAQVTAGGFYGFRIRGIQIFAGERSVLPVEMIPRGASLEEEFLEYDVGPHGLRLTTERTPQVPEEIRVLGRVFIPDRITVHLGAPTASASNVTVPFVDYIKNVASSEIYPTWPERSLRANILCQISLALNRVFTEWYPSRGYSFNITNSTAYDQYFVYGRNIYDSISRIVDQIFNEYIRRPGRIDPYFAEYCDGSTVTCAGLSQWGTVTLAQEGRSVLEILQFYYGNVELAETNEIRAIESSYPGAPLSVGSSGNDVKTIQQQLNRIRINYPAIPAVSRVDGVFGPETRNAVLSFQRIFDLTPDGIVGKATWYRISYLYVAVKKLAELNSEGERPQYDDNAFPGILSVGDTGTGVQTLQFYLKTIAAFNPFLADLAVDGFFGASTENAVREFQRYYGLMEDGIVGERTWNRVVEVYQDITEGGTLTVKPYPGTPLDRGDTGENVRYVQRLLRRIRRIFVTVPLVAEDGIFGERTRLAVREFQRLFGLSVDGVVGQATWLFLNRVFGAVVSGCLENRETPAGRTLRYGSSGNDVASLQRQLNTVGASLAPIPALAVDGKFGSATERAVRTFQGLLGLTVDGVVGDATRSRLTTLREAVEEGCLPTAGRRISPLFRENGAEETSFSGSGEILSGWPEGCPWRNWDQWEAR